MKIRAVPMFPDWGRERTFHQVYELALKSMPPHRAVNLDTQAELAALVSSRCHRFHSEARGSFQADKAAFFDTHCKPRVLVNDANEVLGGFMVLEGELKAMFSNVRGRGVGAHMVAHAIRIGARRLQCFEGYLSDWYAGFGFEISARHKNWHGPQHPDVVTMELP